MAEPAPAVVRTADDATFAALLERYRRRLHVHCYRMLGSVEDADDLVQETFLNAWRSRGQFEGRSLDRHLALPDRHERVPPRALATTPHRM